MASDDPLYARRRIDALTDRRLDGIESEQRDTNHKLDELDDKVDGLGNRLNYIAGGLAALSVVVNLLGPLIIREVFR
jgi:hypothetical protein